jgi:hypothetical protein
MSAEPGFPHSPEAASRQTPLTVGLELEPEQLSVGRAQLYRELDSTRQTLEAFRDALAAATGGALRASPGRVSTALEPALERLLAAIGALDDAGSLSGVLSTLVDRAAQEAPRVALFLLKDGALHGWRGTGFTQDVSSLRLPLQAEELFEGVVQRGEAVSIPDRSMLVPPAFAALPAPVVAMAVPLLVGAQPVAILYADDAGGSDGRTSSMWAEAIQILSRHASANLAYLTAARTADVLRRPLAPDSLSPALPGGSA